MPTQSWIGRIINNSKVQRWSYRSSLIFFIAFFGGFCAVVPIDSIVQASQSSNYALNTFVVVGALVLFVVTGIILATTRIYMQRSALQDIPKRYIPLDDGDLPKECDVMINENFAKCEDIRSMALDTEEEVKHPGLSGPKSELLPPSLSFDEVVRAIGDKLKWDGAIMGTETEVPKNASFREIVAYLEEHRIATNFQLNRDYVELYESLRFSGNLINEDKFIKFMQMSVEFVKVTRLNMGDSLDHRHQRRSYSVSQISRSTTDGFYSKLSLPGNSNVPGADSTVSNFNNGSWLDPTTQEQTRTSGGSGLYQESFDPLQTEEENQRYHDMLQRVGTSQTVLSFRSGKNEDTQ